MNKDFTLTARYFAHLLIGLFLIFIGILIFLNDFRLIGASISTLGLLISGYRHVCRFAFSDNMVKRQKTLFGIPLSTTKQMPADTITHVELVRESRSDTESLTSSYKVFVTYVSGSARFWISESQHFSDSRIFSEKLARRLNLPLHDKSSAGLQIRQAAELDMSLGQRLRSSGKSVTVPILPSDRNITLSRQGDTMVIRMAAQSVPLLGYLLLVGVPATLMGALWMLGEKGIVLFVIFPISYFPLRAAINLPFPSYLLLDKKGVTIKRFTYQHKIPFNELEELIHQDRDIYLISDKRKLVLPYDFATKETARFVIDLIQYHALKYTTPSENR